VPLPEQPLAFLCTVPLPEQPLLAIPVFRALKTDYSFGPMRLSINSEIMFLSLKKKRNKKYASLPGGSESGKAFIMTRKQKVQTEKRPFFLP
jgi:hypothetical protein